MPGLRSVYSESTFRHIRSKKLKADDIVQWRCLIRDKFKWIMGLSQSNRFNVRPVLYDLIADPQELNPRECSGLEEVLLPLRRLILKDKYWNKRAMRVKYGRRLKAPKVAPDLDRETLEKLKSLGYVEN